MKFLTDVGELAVVLELDTEPAEVDLTRDGLGDACLDAAVEGMLGSHGAQRAPDGMPWAPLKAATVRREGHATIGVQSGVLWDRLFRFSVQVGSKRAFSPRAIWRICSIDQPIASDARFRSRIRRVHRLSADFSPYIRLVITRALLLIPSTAALV